MPSLLSQTLKIDLAQPYRPIIPNFIPRTIPSLSFNIGSRIIPYAQPRSIHSFVPKIPDAMPPAFVLPDFRPFKNLRRIAVSTIFTPEDGSMALSRIARFFDYADPENLEKLEELSISISLEANQDGLVYPYDWDLPTWKDLDSRLASLIGTLRQVMIHINGYKPYYQETGTAQLVKLDDVVELLESQFVKLRKADIFKLVATR
ncbi:hypothetical protein ONZ45_g10743 [Pleurotus djamor]|nr:hypothetical protein ONZ45_g10743 [Pleurotus djamor]